VPEHGMKQQSHQGGVAELCRYSCAYHPSPAHACCAGFTRPGSLSPLAHLINMLQQVSRVLVHPVSARPHEFVLAVPFPRAGPPPVPPPGGRACPRCCRPPRRRSQSGGQGHRPRQGTGPGQVWRILTLSRVMTGTVTGSTPRLLSTGPVVSIRPLVAIAHSRPASVR
jgi:hypothetical protein